MPNNKHRVWLIVLLMLFVLMSGCDLIALQEQVIKATPTPFEEPGGQEEQPLPTATATETLVPTPTEPPPAPTEPLPTATRAPQPTPAPEYGDGPWLIFLTGAGAEPIRLWALSADGKLNTLSLLDYVGPMELAKAVSPDGTRVAFITQDESLPFWGNLTLTILNLATGEQEAVISLTSAETEPGPDTDFGDELWQPLRAVAEVDSLAWSPDGARLAFMSVQAGPSSDLYLYDTADRSVTRLTDGPTEGLRPTWSPDGRYILHLGVFGLGTGAGLAVDRVWAADTQTGRVLDLYEASQTGDENWIGWADDRTFVASSWDAFCGARQLRTESVVGQPGQPIWPSYFSDAALSPQAGVVAVVIDQYIADCDPDLQPGIYLSTLGRGPAVQVSDAPAYQVEWEPAARVFIARVGDGGVLTITPDGTVNVVEGPPFGQIALSPDGELLAWAVGTGIGDVAVSGLWVGPLDGRPRQVGDAPLALPVWSPDGRVLAAIGTEGVYLAPGPDFYPELVVGLADVGLSPSTAAWVARDVSGR